MIDSGVILPYPEKRQPGLDELRGIAVLLVLAFHGSILPGGWIGVDLFFVISGFLISGVIFREYLERGRFDLVRFWKRRALRIYPPFLCVVVSETLSNWRAGELTWQAMVAELTWTQNYIQGIDFHTWSLAIEEHFYFLMALLVWWSIRKRHRLSRLPIVCGAIGVLCLGARIATTAAIPNYAALIHYEPTHLRIDSLALGVWLSYRNCFGSGLPAVPRWCAVIVLALLELVFGWKGLEDPFTRTIGYTIVFLGCGVLVWSAAAQEIGIAGMKWIGQRSYSIYLFHPLCFSYARHLMQTVSLGAWWETGLALALSITVGTAIHGCVERPALDLRRIIFP